MSRFILYLFLLIKIIDVSCEGNSSLAFVIDDTRSMKYDISQVRKEVDSIMDIVLYEMSQIKEIVLVTFNDPRALLRKKTNSREAIKSALKSIRIGNYDNHDCPEASLAGIKIALENSLPNSYLYVFTDADAKDLLKHDSIKRLCQYTQSQVNFVLTGDCGNISSPGYKVYNEIASATGGQVYRVDKDEVDQVMAALKAMIEGKKATYLAQNVPDFEKYTEIPFTLDEKTEYAIISASGKNVMLKIRGPYLHTKKLIWTKNSKVVKLIDTVPGDYAVKVKGSEAPNIVIYGRTDFVFTQGFSEFIPKYFDDTTKQPVAGSESHLSIQVEDPDHEVYIVTAQILDMAGNVLKKLSLIKKEGDFYYTPDTFRSPTTSFHIAILGKIKKTGKPIKRITSVPVQPRIPPPSLPDAKPEVSIKEGKNAHIDHNGHITLTCDVTGKPKPSIVWKDSKNNIRQSKTYLKMEPNVFVSQLILNNLKESDTYRCEASNILGKAHASITVEVTPAFTVISHPSGNLNIPYGTEKTLTCDIKSFSGMELAWFLSDNSGETRVESSNKYVLSKDKTKLTIKSMDTDRDGTYICKAWLTADENTNVQFSVNITTGGLSLPVLDETVKSVSVNELESTSLECRVRSAVPPAEVKWLYRSPFSTTYAEVSASNVNIKGKTLTIDAAKRENTGNYKCIAKNSVGEAEHVIELKVKGKPQVELDKTSVTLDYPVMDKVTCKVKANPKPTIVWKDDMGNVVVDASHQVKTANDFEYLLAMTIGSEVGVNYFYCYAENDQGVSFGKLRVENISPINVGEEPKKPIELDYGKQATLYCNITSKEPLFIKWYKVDEATNRKEQINDPAIYTLLAERSELRIHSMDVDRIGQYICEAELLYDKRLKAEYKLNVTVKDIGAPVIEKEPAVVEVKENGLAIIPCKLLKGIPPPEMIWEFMKQGSVTYQRISGAGQYLRISDANMADAGRYRCTAKNKFGKAEKYTDLIVYKSPAVKIAESNKINVNYNAPVSLTCKVTAHPKPTITWKDNENKTWEAKDTYKYSDFEYRSVLALRNVKKSTTYYCIAENNQGTASAEVDITVKPSFNPIPPLPETTNVDYGKRSVIPCDIDSDVSVKRTWYRLNKLTGVKEPIVTSDKVKISFDGKELTIYSMTLDLEGEYSCEGVLESDDKEKREVKTTLKVSGLVKPEIDKTVAMVKISENDTAIINCMIKKGAPNPDIAWQYKSSDGSQFKAIVNSDERLEIKKASVADSGIYKCNASNVAGWDQHEIQLIVQKKPVIIVENDTVSYRAVLGDSLLRVPCKAIGNPTPIITWKKGDEKIVADKNHLIENGSLIINEPDENDSDEYTCEATNDVGKDTKAFEVIVTESLEEFGPQHNIYIREGETRKIDCKLPYTDPNSVRWYFEETYTNVTGPSYVLVDANDMMDGNYSCRVSDRTISATETYVVDVGYAPILLNTETKIKWSGGNDEVVNCQAKAKPWAQAKWLFNGKPINNTDPDILTFFINNIGVYTCEVSNVHGSTGKNVTVTASVCIINRKENMKRNSPLLLERSMENDTQLLWPNFGTSADVIIIEPEMKITLLCPSNDGIKNKFIEFPELNEIDLTCDHEDIFLLDGKAYRLADLDCKEVLKPVIVETGKPCINNNTEWLHVGFNETVFIDVYKVCIDTINGMPLHTSYIMYEMNSINPSIDQDWYIYEGYEKGNEAYTCDNHTTSCCYAKKQFVNILDVSYGAPQISTYIDHVNSVPIWQQCSTSRRVSWNQVEESIRGQFKYTNALNMWTGGSDFKQDEFGGLVPRYLWKVVMYHESDIIVVVYVNDQHPRKDDIRCTNICKQRMKSQFPCEDKYTYVCEFEDFLSGFHLTRENIGF